MPTPARLKDMIMRYMKIVFLLVTVAGIYLYNSNWFQASFFTESYYRDICFMPFDVTEEGGKIVIPIKYKYKTCYRLAIGVPDKDVFHDNLVGSGDLTYRFVSKGHVLATGHTHRPDRRHLMLNHGMTSINILVFHLPFPGAGDDLELQLSVHEPFKFLDAYKGQTFCKISPDYNPKFNECYNGGLMVPGRQD